MSPQQEAQVLAIYIYIYKYTMIYQSNTTKLYYVCIVLGQHVSILIESSSGPPKKTDPYLAMFKMRCGIPNAYILDITMYKMHVSLCSYCTVWILISKTLTGTYEGGYKYVFEISRIWRKLHICIWDLKYICVSYVYWTVRHCVSWRIRDQFDVTSYVLFHFFYAQHRRSEIKHNM